MSVYAEAETPFRDADLLMASLQELGITHAVRHPKAVNLSNYNGQVMAETAEIIIPRKFVGSLANDVGFKMTPDGTYKAIICDYAADRYGFSPEFRGKLAATYARHGITRELQKAGLRMIGTKKVNGKTQLQFVKV